MRRMCIAFLLFIFLTYAESDAQIFKSMIRGKIFDAESREPLPHTNVFLANTTLGTVSKLDGSYAILDIPPGKYQLIVNRVGFKLVTRDIELRNVDELAIDIELTQKPIDMGEMQVIGQEPKDWKNQLKLFRKRFLGETDNAEESTILNPEVLRFQIHPKTRQLMAFADSALCIANDALGYRLYIVFDKFQWGEAGGLYSVFPKFEEMQPEDESEQREWIKNRRETYLGSFQHFITSMAQGNAGEEGFQFYLNTMNDMNIGGGTRISEDRLVFDLYDSTSSVKKFQFVGHLEVVYRGRSQSSYIKLNQSFVLIDPTGYVYPPLAIVRYGEWAKARIADTLPLDYVPEK
ncbi:carboxypeptidase-like regulatory domain-containing protein [candidate division KSB1 bacterium]|nr:carboxypeptidase-like regulatory domain-containing protein [candidate division KSB1 bacterium]